MFEKKIIRTNNVLLQKSDVGKVKRSTYDLPQNEFRYGKASGQWSIDIRKNNSELFQQIHQQPITNQSNKNNNNKTNNNNNNDNNRYNKIQKVGNMVVGMGLPNEQFMYGQQYKPSTPINNVISNLYGLISEHELDLAYQQHLDKKNVMNQEKQRLQRNSIFKKAQKVHRSQSNPNMVFKMAKFQNVKSKCVIN